MDIERMTSGMHVDTLTASRDVTDRGTGQNFPF